ncbi:MAG: T9SS type A sorting domain-containing protein [Bacteroidetes bacterium]|nr:T9SS type A sorting domain-containing protein [Bacteroidota bacterium]MCA6444843.1 T9SS type A sorting domain-containing protein [Bacteroidota bacterium]
MKKTIYLFLIGLTLNSVLKSQCSNATFPTIGSNTTTICAGGSVTFTRTGTSSIGGFSGFEWVYSTTSGNCSSSIPFSSLSNPSPNNVSFSFPTAGTYYVRMRAIASSGGCLTFWPNGQCSTGQELIINVLGAPTFSMGSSTRYFCPGYTARLTPTISGAPTSFQWLRNGVPIASATTATLNIAVATATDAALYSLVATSSCGSATSAAVTLTTLTTSSFFGSGPNILIGSTSNPYFISPAINSAIPLTPATYSWSQVGTSTITSATNTTNILVNAPTTPSTFTLQIATALNTCVAVSTLAVNAVSCFSLVGSVGSMSALNCEGLPINLFYSFTPTGTVVPTFNWVGPNSFTSTVQNPSVTTSASALNSGIYTLTANNAGCLTTRTLALNINLSPTIALTSSSGTICAGASATLNPSGGVSYTFTPVVPLSLVISPSITTSYTVVGVAPNSCTSSASITQNVVVCTGLEKDAEDQLGLNVFPNPTEGLFTIENNSNKQFQSIKIFDALGHELMNKKVDEKKFSFDLGEYPKGIYLIQLSDVNNRIETKRLIKN